MNFFDLPQDIINIIYTYDSTYKEIYDFVIKDIYNLPTYELYDDEFESYLFSVSPCKGLYIYTHIDSNNYKNALKQALKNQ